MKTADKGARHRALSYRLRKGVHSHCEEETPYLLLDFPLKTIRLHVAWKPVLELLSCGSAVSLYEIQSAMSRFPREKVEAFLNDLVRKGFLEQQGLAPLSQYPTVSIIIPVRNRPVEIKECLHSLLALDYPQGKLEVIVVDDASTDGTPHEAAKFPVRLIALKERRQASFCRNLGAEAAKGEILAFMDSDCLADPMWLRELLPAFKDVSIGIAGGLVDSFSTERGLDRYEKVKSSLVVGSWFKRSSEEDRFFYVPSCNLLVRKELFLKLGGFRPELHVGEDVDLCWRMQDAGYHVEYRPVGKIYHKHRNRVVDFCSRRFDYGSSEPLLQHLHDARKKRFLFPPWESLFWILMLSAVWFGEPALLFFPLLSSLADILIHGRRLRRAGFKASTRLVALARMRSCGAFFYHCCSFASRYYLVCSLIITPLMPGAGAIVAAMHMLTSMVEFIIKKPNLDPVSFLFYFSLEQVSYQLGVWWGAVKVRRFNSVIPEVVFGN